MILPYNLSTKYNLWLNMRTAPLRCLRRSPYCASLAASAVAGHFARCAGLPDGVSGVFGVFMMR